jgi:hypothetical protein
MHEYGSLPRARRDGLLEETVGDELLLYDQDSHTAHCLSPIAACVWRHCDGERDVTELALLAGTNENVVADALHELREKDLLDAEPGLMQDIVPGESRREVIGRVARYGAAAASASMIVSAAAATPAMASSGETPACETDGGEGKTCCICMNNSCITSTMSSSDCTTYCGEMGRGGFRQWTNETKCSP